MHNHYHKTTLANNLRVISVPMDSVKSVTVLIMVGAGSRYETAETNGISHFLEHMAFKGTTRRPSSLAISSEIDGIGGEFNAFTSKDNTGYYVKAQAKHLPILMDVLSDMLLHSLFNEQEINKERGVIIEEINLYEDTPMRKIGDLFENLLYDGHPLGSDISGKAENIRKISRQDFMHYLGRLYNPKNCVVTVAGGIEITQSSNHASRQAGNPITQLVEKCLGGWKDKETDTALPIADKQAKPELLVKYKDSKQAHLSLGFRAYPVGHPKRYAEAVLSSILGGGMSSRMFIEIRNNRSLCYYVRTGADQYKDVGYFTTTAGVDVSRIEEAVSAILDQYKGLRDEKLPITAEEFRRAKEYIKGKFILELEDSQAVAGLYAGQEIIEEKIRTPEETIRNIDAVTINDVYSVAKEIFIPEKLNLAVIGPYKGRGRFEKLLSV